MASIKEAIIDLAEEIKGSGTLFADDIASAIALIGEYYGTSKQAANQAAATAAGESDDKVKLSDFNGLLTKLKTAGIMEADTTP